VIGKSGRMFSYSSYHLEKCEDRGIDLLKAEAMDITFSTVERASQISIVSKTARCKTWDMQGIPRNLLVLAMAALMLLPRSLVIKQGISSLIWMPVVLAC
jgi:hypothetical protein